MAADENTDARAVFSSEHPDHHVCVNTETSTGAADGIKKARERRIMCATQCESLCDTETTSRY